MSKFKHLYEGYFITVWNDRGDAYIYETETLKLECPKNLTFFDEKTYLNPDSNIFSFLELAKTVKKQGIKILPIKTQEIGENKTTQEILDPKLYPIVNRFPRNCAEEKFDSPYLEIDRKSTMERLDMRFTILTLPITPTQIIDKSIKKYLKSFSDCSMFSDYFKIHLDNLSNKNQYQNSQAAFSSLIWSFVEHFMLGIPLNDQQDFAYVWNDLLSPPKPNFFDRVKAQSVNLLRFFIDLPKLRNYILKIIRARIEVEEKDLQDIWIIDYWLKTNLFEKVWDSLNPFLQEEINNFSIANSMTPKEVILRDNFLFFMIAIQENMASTLTSSLVLYTLKEKNDSPDLKDILFEALNFLPSAGPTRQLHCPMKIFTKNAEQEWDLEYEANAKSRFAISGITHSHLNGDYKDGSSFNLHRQTQPTYSTFFGNGPHECPGKKFALTFLPMLLEYILTNYRIAIKYPKDSNPYNLPYYSCSFVLQAPLVKKGQT